MSQVYVGLELGASDCWVAIADEGGNIKTHRRFETTEANLISLAQSLEGEALVLMEECDIAPWARRVLLPHAGAVVVSDLPTAPSAQETITTRLTHAQKVAIAM